jgi:hypothetical protein
MSQHGWWGAAVDSAWLDMALGKNYTTTAVGIRSYGDKKHDCGVFELQVPISVYPNWRELPALPSSAIAIGARNDFESFWVVAGLGFMRRQLSQHKQDAITPSVVDAISFH